MVEWLLANWVTLIEAILLILSGCSMIAALTPTPKDDQVIKKIITTISFLRPGGGFKFPFFK